LFVFSGSSLPLHGDDGPTATPQVRVNSRVPLALIALEPREGRLASV
jgi:hypothetical protein